jgi:phospholipid/cholesterol/gamma-HCH transport system substrate-binding protein
VRLELGTEMQFAKPGDTLACGVIPPFSEGLESVKDQLINILVSVDTIAVSLKDVLIHQNGAEKLAHAFQNIETMTANLNQVIASNKANVGKIVDEMAGFAVTLNAVSPDLKRIIANFDLIADSLARANVAEVIVNVNNTILQLEEVVRKVNTGQGDIAKLLNDEDLYKKLGNSLQSLDELLIDIRKNPKKYINVTVFGKNNKEK